MAGSGRVGDEALAERWEQSLIGLTGASVRPRRHHGSGRPIRTRRSRHPHRAAPHRTTADSNRLYAERRARRLRRRFVTPVIVLGAGLAGSTVLLALAPVGAEHVALACSSGVSVSWVDQHRDVLGLRLPDVRDRLEVTAPSGSVVAVAFTDGVGAAYPTGHGTVSDAGSLAVEPPRPLPASEHEQWRVEVVVSADGVHAVTCDAPLS